MLAISHIFREKSKQNSESSEQLDSLIDGRKMLVLSLGTGAAKHEEKYDAQKASQWGLLGWIYDNITGSTPIIDIFGDASADIVDFQVSTLFQSHNHKKNYLRIQVF